MGSSIPQVNLRTRRKDKKSSHQWMPLEVHTNFLLRRVQEEPNNLRRDELKEEIQRRSKQSCLPGDRHPPAGLRGIREKVVTR